MFAGPEPSLWVSRKSIRRKVRCWLDNQHWARWRGLDITQRQARELILGPSPSAETSFLSFHRTQSRVMIGLLAGHNTLRKHFYLMGLTNSPLCRRWGVEDKTSAHIFCECQALASLRHKHLGSFLDPQDIKCLSLRAIWKFSKGTVMPWTDIRLWGTKGLLIKAYVHRDCKVSNPNANQSINQRSLGKQVIWCNKRPISICKVNQNVYMEPFRSKT